MNRGHVSKWEGDDLDPSGHDGGDPQTPGPAGDPGVPVRARSIVRSIRARWCEREGAWQATIGRWAVRVVPSPLPSIGWEWSAFAAGGRTPHALRCTGWLDREAAQRDAEGTLAASA